MAKKKSITQVDIIGFYMDYVLMHNHKPHTVYAFAKDNKFEEQKFYEFFSSFESLEQNIFKIFFDHAITNLDKSKDYHSFDARNKLLSFYYTFFEILTANRSYVVHVLEGNKNQLKSLKTLAHLKKRFTNYIDDSSSSFEKTDLFIEKSVRASFDLIDTTPLKSLIDFGKFLYKEKMHMN